ncbi:SIR2 family NAD-dependent protein deacylase [Alicyclobacillus shizuokensis]|uniref:SIR2 family NAD-dependent protein deacylase n=1 Tax=Alicyclobacillus shizuokensis TaxID=392014 RepID=UPI0009F958C9|nr:Sir2 family NAD-dependent protein deacetylase [Alicyclobacillus shizuokensis]MCL6625024.1 iron dicitrate transport regulator FecR [Alicyclobacillus shizuokensis]
MQYEVTLADSPSRLARIQAAVRQAAFPLAITGAGISVASGVPLLADCVAGVTLAEFFRPHLFNCDPGRFYDAYRRILQHWRTAQPNSAHRALAAARFHVVTQNIDGLHRDAGTAHVLELHGNLRELRCPGCTQVYQSQLVWRARVPHCPTCGAVLRPGFSLEGEPIRHFSRAVDWMGRADFVLVIGTQLEMEPVRRLPQMALHRGLDVIEVNRDAEELVPFILKRG